MRVTLVSSLQDWELSVADQRRLYLLISETLAGETNAVESQKVRTSTSTSTMRILCVYRFFSSACRRMVG